MYFFSVRRLRLPSLAFCCLMVAAFLLGGAWAQPALTGVSATPQTPITASNRTPAAVAPSSEAPIKALTLRQYLQLVLDRNEALQGKLIEFKISHKRYQAEKGAFEPDLVASVDRESNFRQNTVQQQAALGFFGGSSDTFWERNNNYSGGLEELVPTGAKLRLGYSLEDLHNSIQPTNVARSHEYVTFFGVTATQPLLKNAGFTATLASLRLASLDSEVAYQQYRRQLMLAVSTAEAAYWNLYMAQEQVRFFEESTSVAETILKDSQAKLETGQGSQLEVLEARSGLAFRQSKLADAEERRAEAINQVLGLYAALPVNGQEHIVAVDKPALLDAKLSFFAGWRQAYELNPDYLAQRKKLLQAGVRIGYAWNQSLPEINLKGSYGLNGYGLNNDTSWQQIENRGFPSWSIGVELRIPLAGNIRGRNELAAARLGQEAALLGLHDLETQIANAIHTAIQKVQSRRDSVPRYEEVVDFARNVLQSQMDRLQVGQVESRKVLEADVDLFEARNSLLDTLVQYRRAMLELELAEGTLLKHRNLEVSADQLNGRTRLLMRPTPQR
jgi:outer membrane protein